MVDSPVRTPAWKNRIKNQLNIFFISLNLVFISVTCHCSCNSSWHMEHACTFDWVGETGWSPCGGSWWLTKNGKYGSDGRAGFWRTRIENNWNLPTLPQTKHITSDCCCCSDLCSFELCADNLDDLANCWCCVKSMDVPALNSTTSCVDVPKKSILSLWTSFLPNHSADGHNTVGFGVSVLF